MDKEGYVYLMTNKNDSVIYTGVTSNLKKRVYEHRNDLVKGFTRDYRVHKLVYYEVLTSILDAITREKQIKTGSRAKKIKLIITMNPNFEDLYEKI